MKKRELDKIKKKYNRRAAFDINTLSSLSFDEVKECLGVKYNDRQRITLSNGAIYFGKNKHRGLVAIPLEDRERETMREYFDRCDPNILPRNRLGRAIYNIYFDFSPEGYREMINFIILEML